MPWYTLAWQIKIPGTCLSCLSSDSFGASLPNGVRVDVDVPPWVLGVALGIVFLLVVMLFRVLFDERDYPSIRLSEIFRALAGLRPVKSKKIVGPDEDDNTTEVVDTEQEGPPTR